MITIFNRKKLIITYDMKKQNEIRALLTGNNIEYDIRTTNCSGSPSVRSASRTYAGSVGVNPDAAYEYNIYVRKEDYEKAAALINISI